MGLEQRPVVDRHRPDPLDKLRIQGSGRGGGDGRVELRDMGGSDQGAGDPRITVDEAIF